MPLPRALFQRRRAALSVVAVITSIAALFWSLQGTAPRAHADTPIALSVNTSSIIQSNFLGVNAVYHGFSYMPESNNHGMTDSLRALDFARVQNIQLHIARTWYGSDWAMPTWGGSYAWNSTKMTAFYSWLQAMKDRGVTVALNAGWWFTQNVCAPDIPSTCTPRVPTDVDIYTHWISDSLNQLINVKGFTNIQYLMLFTEPLSYASGNVPSGYSNQSFYQYVIERLQTQLNNDGRRGLVKFVGPDITNLASDTSQLSFAANNLNDAIDIYSGHDYNLNGYGYWKQAITSGRNTVSATGKSFWMDEYGKQDETYRGTADYGEYLAEANAAAINAGAQSTLLWIYEDQYYVWPLDTLSNSDSFYNGLQRWGTQQWLPDNQNVRPSWYAFSLMSRYLGGAGTKVYATNDNNGGQTINAVQLPDGSWSVMVVNTNQKPSSIQVTFSSAINQTFYRHLYDPANVPTDNNIIAASAQFNNISTSFSDTLPARAVAIYTTRNDGNRVAFNRYFNGSANDHWVTTGSTTSGYALESTLGYLYPTVQSGTIPLYGCSIDGDHFVSTYANCEGQTVLRTEGWINSSQPSGASTVALYRCYTGSDHFVSTDPNCEGKTRELLLGYANTIS